MLPEIYCPKCGRSADLVEANAVPNNYRAIAEIETALANKEIWPNPYDGEEAQTEIVYASILHAALDRLKKEMEGA